MSVRGRAIELAPRRVALPLLETATASGMPVAQNLAHTEFFSEAKRGGCTDVMISDSQLMLSA